MVGKKLVSQSSAIVDLVSAAKKNVAKPYCTQNRGDCSTCSLVNYGRDCRNERV